MTMIKFTDGRRMPWDQYRRIMLARPPGAMDQALGVTRATSALPASGSDRGRRKLGRDQEKPLDGAYCRATRAYLIEHGLDPDDVDTVMGVLGNYADPADDPEAAEDERAGLGAAGEHAKGERVGLGAAGKQAQDIRRRQMAQDSYLPRELQRWPVPPMSRRQLADFEKRYPGIEKIKIV